MTASRPARALHDGLLLLGFVVVYRVPTIERAFLAALTAAEDQVRRPASVVVKLLDPNRHARSTEFAVLPAASPAAVRVTPRAVRVIGRPTAKPGLGAALAAITSAAPPAPDPLLTVSLSVAPHVVGPADALATAAYARLAAGDRRDAVRLFDAALLLDDPRAPAWRHQRDALTRRWSGSAYSIVRGGGDPALAVTPVLGGGQSGAAIAFTPDPLASRPFAVTARGSLAHDDAGRSAFAAVGVQWHPFVGVTLAAERLIAIGPAAPNDWTVRLAAGTDRTFRRWRVAAYGEGGVVGHATYAAVQGRAAAVLHVAHVELDPGVGAWSSVQRDRGTTVDRVDVGPGIVAHAGPFAAEVDYRVRVAGNAAPGSGPVLTLSAAF